MGVGGIPRIQLASVALRYAEHVISGKIFPDRFLGASDEAAIAPALPMEET
jgi:hypothetical protein